MKRAFTYLSVVFRIFWRDLGRIVKNPVALVVILGVCLMPSLYAWYVIVANWEPYQETQNLKVGVANNDTGCNLTDELTKLGISSEELKALDVPDHLDVGSEVITKLHENHQLGWEYVSEAEAIDRVKSGEYYAAIIIPQDFSKDFASIFSGSFTQPALEYYVNEKMSSVAPHVTEAGAKTLEDTIDSEFVSTVSEVVVTLVRAADTQATSKMDAAHGSLTKSVTDTAQALTQTRTLLDGLTSTIDASVTTIQDGENVLEDASAQIPDLQQKLEAAHVSLQQARDDLGAYGAEATRSLNTSASEMIRITDQAHKSLLAVLGDATSLQAQLTKADSAVQAALTRSSAVLDALSVDPAVAQVPDAEKAIASLKTQIDELEQTSEAFGWAQDDMTTLVSDIQTASDNLAAATDSDAQSLEDASATFETTVLGELTKSLDNVAETVGNLTAAVSSTEKTLTETKSLLGELATILGEAKTGVQATGTTLTSVEDTLTTSAHDLTVLQESNTVKELSKLTDINTTDIGTFMASPVKLQKDTFFPVKNYGTGVTPFFTNLALWAAGFILLAMVKLRVDPDGLPSFTPIQAYWGRWLLFMFLSVIQAVIACVGDLVIGVQCANPVAFVAAGVVTIVVDMNIMYAMAYALRQIGKAINVILLIVQIPGSSGLFPVEMMPPIYQAINPLLPFTYSCNAFREAIAGFYGMHYYEDIGALLLYIPLAILFGIVVGNYAFNLNVMFDKKLTETDLLVTDERGGAQTRIRLRTMFRALLNVSTFRDHVIAREAKFRRYYPTLIRIGWVAIFAQPIIMFCLMNLLPVDINGKVVLLMIMAATIILVDTYLIVVEYLKSDFARQVGLTQLDAQQLQQEAAVRAPLSRFFGSRPGSSTQHETASAQTPPAVSVSKPSSPAPSSSSPSSPSSSVTPSDTDDGRPSEPRGGDKA